MSITKQTRSGRIIVTVVYLAVILITAGGILVGLWSLREMRTVVTDQFNAQQMVIAQTAKARIEREIGGIIRELLHLALSLRSVSAESTEGRAILRQGLERTADSGVRRIDVVDLTHDRVLLLTPAGQWGEQPLPTDAPERSVLFPAGESPALWVSAVERSGAAAEMLAATPITADGSRLLAFRINVDALVSGLLKSIRSGASGYAWLIDASGTFLYHPNPDFIGGNAFTVREERLPLVSYERINFIQQERMLKGEQGTGWYYSPWHRGIVSPMKKLIAYTPVEVANHPPQFWSVAVIAPQSEVEAALRKGTLQLILLMGWILLSVMLGAGTIIWLENRWSKVLESRVLAKTEALAKSEEKYRSLVESAEDLIFTVDREGRFQSVNTFTATFFGGTPEAFIGRHIASAFSEPAAGQQAAIIEQVHRTGKSLRQEIELPLGDPPLWLSANFMPIRTEGGETGAVLCIARDVTENKNLQRQLVNAEKLASLGTLAAGVAHEINNPLGVILGFCELLLHKAEPGSQQFEDLKTIERQGLLCKETVENLLSFARAENQPMAQADVNRCIEAIVKIMRHLLAKKQVELNVQLADPLPPARADTRQLQQVFLNLITNAMAAMEAGGSLTIRSLLERNPRRVVVQFQDTGSGIPPEHMDRIFEPFFTTKPEGQGTGLGLFVSYGIVSSFGGTIECASAPATALGKQRGTTFTVKLPTGSKEESAKT
ncbi:MAG: ATP-binding protein [Desulfobacterales bacterium]|jgi:PAS domain S-box-containing protein|nr:ATP-binding protein [Desulfobacterales bacterium]